LEYFNDNKSPTSLITSKACKNKQGLVRLLN
jgi:hypothetical protein